MTWPGFPWFFKRYAPRLPRLPLPRELPATTAPALAVLAGRAEVARTALDLPRLSRLLHLSGVVRTAELRYGTHPFRAAGSAGGRFPLELYVAVPEGVPLPAGVHWYDPLEHALVQVGPGPPSARAASRYRASGGVDDPQNAHTDRKATTRRNLSDRTGCWVFPGSAKARQSRRTGPCGCRRHD
jgi:hypothetical protein